MSQGTFLDTLTRLEASFEKNVVEPLHNGHLGDRRKWPLWRGGRYGEVGV